MINSSRLDEITQRWTRARILVVGDLMLDEFLRGKVSRISPEAPVPVVELTEESFHPGGSANVVRNLSELGVGSTAAGAIGPDAAGSKLKELLLEGGAGVDAIVECPKRHTTCKTRIVARQQQVVRLDREVKAPLGPEEQSELQARCLAALATHDAVIIADYAKGVVTQQLADAIIADARRLGKIVAVDPKPHHPLNWTGATIVKPNRGEAFQAAGVSDPGGIEAVPPLGPALMAKWGVQMVLITLSEHGMILFQDGKDPHQSPTKARDVFDVSGAGDTVIATFTAALCGGATPVEAMEIANVAAGIVVGKLGTATTTVVEIRATLEG
jgi:D-beta-D-heptose 7-phosphate kinase/D-beta-D-heptose 1-phosphate adenosyltransferase